jgi:glycosyltransferase involved in cell wall biosynthesis
MLKSNTLIYPKITVVTPNYNQGDFLETTIKSVLDQKYPNLEYIIIDGGSNDDSVSIIKKYEKQLYFWVSEADAGMYDAINKGFLKSSGSIMCWINSDDILSENSLEYVATVFNEYPKVNWLQGLPTVIDVFGNIIYQRNAIFSPYYFYFRKHEKTFSFIQQESTFWSRKLWDQAHSHLDQNYLLAADFDLWMRFFKYDKIYCTNKQLGAFRQREGQKSSDKKAYIAEVNLSLNRNFKGLNLSSKIIIILLERLSNINNHFVHKIIKKFQSYFIGNVSTIE